MNRIRCLLIKELAQLRRDRRLFGILVLAPMIQLLVLGFALNSDVKNISLAVRDQDHTFYSRELIRGLGASGYFKISHLTGSEQDDARMLVDGQAGLILTIPPGFGNDILRHRSAPVQLLADGSDSNFGVQGLNYFQRAARMFSEGQVRSMLHATQAPLLPSVTAQTRVWFNPDLKSRFYMVPALMGNLLMITTMLVTSMALVKEREEGTLEQIIVTPLRPVELIIGKLLPFVVVGLVEITLILPLMLLVFGVPLRGNLLTLYVMSGLFLLNTLGLGLFISTLVKTQQQAMLVATFFIMMPFVMLSGFAFPVENMPESIQMITHAIPLKYYLTIIRGIFLKGAGWTELWPQAGALLMCGIVILGLSALKFRKRLD